MYETKTLAPAVVLDASGKPIEPLLPAGMLVRLEDQLHEQVRHMPQVGYTLCHVYCEGRLRWVPTTALADLDDALPGPADLMFVSNVKAFQLSVFDMWTAFTQMMRLINSEQCVIPKQHAVVAMVLFQSASDVLTQAGGAIFSLRGEGAVELAKLPDDVASVRLGPFMQTVRQDKIFADQIMAQARSLSDTCSNLAPDLRDTALAALLDAHVAAARPLIKTFQQAVLALTQGCHQ
jgi:hypothetical protein